MKPEELLLWHVGRLHGLILSINHALALQDDNAGELLRQMTHEMMMSLNELTSLAQITYDEPKRPPTPPFPRGHDTDQVS